LGEYLNQVLDDHRRTFHVALVIKCGSETPSQTWQRAQYGRIWIENKAYLAKFTNQFGFHDEKT